MENRKSKILLILAFAGMSLGANAQVTVVDSGYCGANLTWALY